MVWVICAVRTRCLYADKKSITRCSVAPRLHRLAGVFSFSSEGHPQLINPYAPFFRHSPWRQRLGCTTCSMASGRPPGTIQASRNECRR